MGDYLSYLHPLLSCINLTKQVPAFKFLRSEITFLTPNSSVKYFTMYVSMATECTVPRKMATGTFTHNS